MFNLIKYFSEKHLIVNVLFFGVLIFAFFSWKQIGKEELPEFTSNWIRITTIYPGAPASDVELFVTKPLEDELKGIVGIDETSSNSSSGVSSIRIVLEDDYPDKDEVVQEIKDAILRADMPAEVRDLPKFRQFKSSAKAILDVGLYLDGIKSLNTQDRQKLQELVLSLENQLLSLKEVSSVEKDYYRKPELQIRVDPTRKKEYDVSLSLISEQIRRNNIRVPVGTMQDRGESRVTALNEYENVEQLNDLIIRGNYTGENIRLKQLATVKDGFEKTTNIFKVNGHEGVFLNIRKSLSIDILSAQAIVKKTINEFQKNNIDNKLKIVLMDDESFAVRNRLSIIGSNGMLGFILIFLTLLFFVDLKASFWVAMGIPFSMAFSLIIANIAGYTINNMTLAGIIIVLGVVVDDAVIVAEIISKKREEGLSPVESIVEGCKEVYTPITFSILTTCVAFIPLIFFEGFFGKLVSFIPLIVILMLIGSLVESLFLLPSHVSGEKGWFDKYKFTGKKTWFKKYELMYQNFLYKVINLRVFVISFFIVTLLGGIFIFKTKMKFVMFPREESQEVVIKVEGEEGIVRQEMAKLIEPIEEMFYKDTENVVGIRATIAVSRRGGQVKENEASILAELTPADTRKTSLNELMKTWKEKTSDLEGIKKVKFLRGRWGRDSGSAVEIQIQENNDKTRSAVANTIKKYLEGKEYTADVEIDRPIMKREYIFKLNQDKLVKLNVNPLTVTRTLRAFVEGIVLYSINKGEEEIDVKITVDDNFKTDLNTLLDLKVENNQGLLIKLVDIATLEEMERPISIQRANFKRASSIFGNLKEKVKVTPLEIADDLEKNLFPEIYSNFPTTILEFKGEIKDSRESQGEFTNSVLIALLMIYMLLVIMFDSMYKPFIVLSIVPFGLAGIAYVLLLHGMSVYGFFAAIGALGMLGVVINDAIVMVNKIELNILSSPEDRLEALVQGAATRLRPILLTTFTTVVGVLPTAYGFAGYDSILAEMMLTMGWGLAVGTCVTLLLIPCIYSFLIKGKRVELVS